MSLCDRNRFSIVLTFKSMHMRILYIYSLRVNGPYISAGYSIFKTFKKTEAR